MEASGTCAPHRTISASVAAGNHPHVGGVGAGEAAQPTVDFRMCSELRALLQDHVRAGEHIMVFIPCRLSDSRPLQTRNLLRGADERPFPARVLGRVQVMIVVDADQFQHSMERPGGSSASSKETLATRFWCYHRDAACPSYFSVVLQKRKTWCCTRRSSRPTNCKARRRACRWRQRWRTSTSCGSRCAVAMTPPRRTSNGAPPWWARAVAATTSTQDPQGGAC